MVMGEEYTTNPQWRTTGNRTDESPAPKKGTPPFKLWIGVLYSLLFIALSSCGSSKKVIEERQKPTIEKEVVKIQPKKKESPQPRAPLAVMTNKEKIIAYVARYAPMAQQEMKSYGIPASITLAQGILESGMGFGRLAVEGNNHFGIKCHTEWNGKRIYHDDDEKGECFRVYTNAEDSFTDHSLFLRDRSRYAFLFDLKNTNYKAWAKGLKKAGYATDPKYPDKLISLIERFDLTRFDKKYRMAEKPQKKTQPPYIHTVQKGDTLYSVSKQYNIPMERIIEANNIQNQTIYLGQSLNIPSNP